MMRYHANRALLAGACLDLLITIPVAYYFLVVRSGAHSMPTIAPVFVLSMLRASFLIPMAGNLKTFIGVVCEVALIGFVAMRVYGTIRTRSRPQEDTLQPHDVTDMLYRGVSELIPIPAMARILASELAVFYYAFFSWRSRPVSGGFSMHKESGIAALFGLLAGVSVVEAALVHLVVQRWSVTVAWILTAASIYGAVLLTGLARAFIVRSTILTPDTVELRCGLLWKISVPRTAISAFTVAAGPQHPANYVSLAKLADPQYILELQESVIAEGLYGRSRKVTRIGMAMDDSRKFEQALRSWLAA